MNKLAKLHKDIYGKVRLIPIMFNKNPDGE